MPTVVELETLMTRFLGDNSDLVNKLKDIEKQFTRTVGASNRAVSSLKSTFTSFSNTALDTALSLVKLDDGLMGVITNSVKLYAEAESLKVSFEVLTNSAEVASDTLKGLYKFAAETPFTVPQVTQAAKQMLAYGFNTDELISTMRTLGDVASGVDKPLKDLAYTYGTLKTQGTAMMIDIRQFAMRGIPIYLALAKALKLVDAEATNVSEITRARIDELIHRGRVNFEMVEQAFKQMSGMGGQFNGMMEKQSKTLKGLFTNMQDDIDSVLRDIGKTISEEMHLKEAMVFVSNLAKDFKELDPQVKKNIAQFIIFSAAIIAGTGAVITLSTAVTGLGLVLGTTGTLATLAAGSLVALQVAAVAAGAYLASYFSDAVDQMKGFNTEIDRVADGLSNMEKDSKAVRDLVENSLKLSRTFKPDEKKDYLAERIELLGKTSQTAKDKLAEVAKELDGIRKNNNAVELQLFKRGEVEELVEQSKRLRNLIKENKEGQDKLSKEREGVVGGEGGNAKEYVKLSLKIKEETAELGKNHIEKLLAKAAIDGMNESQLLSLKRLQGEYELRKSVTDALEEEKKQKESLKDAVDSLNKSLIDEYETLKDTTGQHKSLRLEQRALELGLYKELSVKLNLAKMNESIVFSQKEYNKLVEEWKHIVQEMRTPQEKFLEQRSHLNKLLDSGTITFDQYNKAMEYSEKKMLDATDAAKALEAALKGIDAALSGSAEAKGRINAFLELAKMQKDIHKIFSVDAPMPRLIGSSRPDVPRDGRGFIKPFGEGLRPLPPRIVPPEENIMLAARAMFVGARIGGLRAIVESQLDRTGGFGNDGLGIGDPTQQARPVRPLPPNETDKDVVDLLSKIYVAISEGLKKPTVTIEPADISR